MSDEELEARLRCLAWAERGALVLLLAHLAEFDRRRLYADRGHPSLFAYCTRVLGHSEQGAYKRIQAARAAREHPTLLARLAAGELHLSAIVVLAPHLRPDNAAELLDAARGKTTRELERVAAGLCPRPDALDRLLALPGPARRHRHLGGQGVVPFGDDVIGGSARSPLAGDGGDCGSEKRPARGSAPGAGADPAASSSGHAAAQAGWTGPVAPVAPLRPAGPRELINPLSSERFLFRFSGGESLRAKYHKARELLRLKPATGAMETVFERGLDALLDRIDPVRRQARRKVQATSLPGNGHSTRAIPRAVRDAVWERDGGRCVFVGPDGARCEATAWLELDHVVPYALGGRSDDPANLRLACKAHNLLLARRTFGEVAARRGERRRPE